MKKIILIIIITINVFAGGITDKYLNYTNKLVYYGFNLDKFDQIHAPFERVIRIKTNKNIKNSKILVKSIKITLLSIFNDQAYFLIKEYLGDQLIKEYRRWIKLNNKIGDCKIYKITLSKVILKCPNKMLIKTLNKKILRIKESK